MALTQSKKEERLGSSKCMNCGSLATIIRYKNARDMSVQFEDGTIVEIEEILKEALCLC